MSDDAEMVRALPAKVQADAVACAAEVLPGDPEAVAVAARRVGLAFAAAVAAAQRPEDWMRVSRQSVMEAVRASIETDLYPGGAMPVVYLVPRGGTLAWSITHRGVAELCRREGYGLRPVPVHTSAEVEVEAGLVTHLAESPDAWPTSMDDLRGVMVEVTDPEGRTMRHWCPQAMIRQRAAAKGAGPVWRSWPVEMAIKAAVLYLARRGALPVSGLQAAVAYETPPPEVRPPTALADVLGMGGDDE